MDTREGIRSKSEAVYSVVKELKGVLRCSPSNIFLYFNT